MEIWNSLVQKVFLVFCSIIWDSVSITESCQLWWQDSVIETETIG